MMKNNQKIKVLYSLIYAPEKGGSGAPIYTYNLLKNISKIKSKPGVIFSISKDYMKIKNKYFNPFPVLFNKTPIFDNQPQVKASVAFKNMKRREINIYIKKMLQKHSNIIYKKNII